MDYKVGKVGIYCNENHFLPDLLKEKYNNNYHKI
jgi:hypothetical protein